jgi:hypothetical protein
MGCVSACFSFTFRSHNLIVFSLYPISPEQDATCVPSGLKVTQFTGALCPSRVFVTWPEARSHNLIVLSLYPRFPEQDANCVPSGLKETQFTGALCPVRVFVIWPVARSQISQFSTPCCLTPHRRCL